MSNDRIVDGKKEILDPVSFVDPHGQWRHMVVTKVERQAVRQGRMIGSADEMMTARWSELPFTIQAAWDQSDPDYEDVHNA